jgi:hypothetical protein
MIRRAKIDDVPAIAQVHVNSYRTIYRGLMLDEHLAAFSEQTRAAVFAAYLQDGTYPIDVLDIEGASASAATVFYRGRHIEAARGGRVARERDSISTRACRCLTNGCR